MKKIILTLAVTICVLAISYGQTNAKNLLLKNADSSKTDSLRYELIISDPGYETFLISQNPMEYYSESYYKTWNNMYVIEWNSRYISGPQQELYENSIDYNNRTDYGIELEYKLYYYFRFFEQKNNVALIRRGK